MVRHALESLKEAKSDNWELAFLDDFSNHPGSCVVEQVFGEKFRTFKFFNTFMTTQDKLQSGGMMGDLMNRAIRETCSDLVIMLCDDDAVCPDYFINLDRWFTEHPDEMACYSHVHVWNPVFENFRKVHNLDCDLNHTSRMMPWTKVDSSQVAWRTSLNKELGVWFEEGRTKCLDAKFYEGIGQTVGKISFSGFVGQYKGYHSAQLGHHDLKDLWNGQSLDVVDGERLTPAEVIYSLIDRYILKGDLQEARRICERAIQLHPADTNFYLLLRKAS